MMHAHFFHAPAMAAVHRDAFTPEEAWDAEIIANQLALPGVFGGIDIDGAMALARVVVDEAELLTFAVHSRLQRRGVGYRLLQSMMREAWRRGAVRMLLEVSVNNPAGRALYEKTGFHPIGRRRAYYANGDDATVMEVLLSAPEDA
jgi:ribosomal-protein-alanine N-acetyltransferase